jgi:hypothetical protein
MKERHSVSGMFPFVIDCRRFFFPAYPTACYDAVVTFRAENSRRSPSAFLLSLIRAALLCNAARNID